MESTYEYFPDDIKHIISLNDAKIFDEHNNNVMYQMAPLIEEKVGEKRASEIYKEMAKTVIPYHGLKVAKNCEAE